MIDRQMGVNLENTAEYHWHGGIVISGRQKKYYKYLHVISLAHFSIIYFLPGSLPLAKVHYHPMLPF